MNQIFCLTNKGLPVCTSFKEEHLKEKIVQYIECIEREYTEMNIVNRTDSSIAYYVGGRYEEDDYRIIRLDILGGDKGILEYAEYNCDMVGYLEDNGYNVTPKGLKIEEVYP